MELFLVINNKHEVQTPVNQRDKKVRLLTLSGVLNNNYLHYYKYQININMCRSHSEANSSKHSGLHYIFKQFKHSQDDIMFHLSVRKSCNCNIICQEHVRN